MADSTSIYEALSAVMADVGAVAKRDVNQHQHFNFRGIDAVVNAASPALRRHGVVVVPEVISVNYETVQTTTGKPSTACRVVVRYVFYGPAGDHLSTVVAGEAWDAGDKSTPKAMSVAFRTALLQSLALPTDEPDPDESTFERGSEVASPVPDPLDLAKRAVWGEWQTFSGGGDAAAMKEHYEAWCAQPLADATADQFLLYAEFLKQEQEAKP